MLNIISHLGNTSENTRCHLTLTGMATIEKKTNADKDVAKSEPSHIAGEKAERHNYFGKRLQNIKHEFT